MLQQAQKVNAPAPSAMMNQPSAMSTDLRGQDTNFSVPSIPSSRVMAQVNESIERFENVPGPHARMMKQSQVLR
ncbi:hypothetical protein UFOVP755_65 [uncultured Caudovirales phage]|uniref:Uncharacterized protein n=1 Tax=uncultured Caudovirales phage TaxID=2100421 RepID=A0A6J7X5Q6_9CAUD|nr:hypothetical protein UFOVP755_65 [uncultured Caudovirales phage]